MPGAPLICLEDDPELAISLAHTALSREDGVVLFPTDTVYGLLAGLEAGEGYRRIFELKQRPVSQPLQVLTLASTSLASDVFRALAPWPDSLLKFTAGRATVVLDAECFKGLPSPISFLQPGAVGVRVPSYAPLRELLRNQPHQAVWATSANRTGEPPLASTQELQAACTGWLANIQVAVCTRALLASRASEVLRLTNKGPQLLR